VRPIDAVRDVMVQQTLHYTTEEMTSIDKLMKASETLLARKQTFYAEQELKLFSTLCEVWRQPERRGSLRMVAMVSIGALRLSIQAWSEQSGRKKPIAEFLQNAFGSLRSEL